MARVCLFALILICALMAGCKYIDFFGDTDSAYNQTNELWRQGYGFNNPNADRIKHGKEPLDF
jgi:hypothetical protein